MSELLPMILPEKIANGHQATDAHKNDGNPLFDMTALEGSDVDVELRLGSSAAMDHSSASIESDELEAEAPSILVTEVTTGQPLAPGDATNIDTLLPGETELATTPQDETAETIIAAGDWLRPTQDQPAARVLGGSSPNPGSAPALAATKYSASGHASSENTQWSLVGETTLPKATPPIEMQQKSTDIPSIHHAHAGSPATNLQGTLTTTKENLNRATETLSLDPAKPGQETGRKSVPPFDEPRIQFTTFKQGNLSDIVLAKYYLKSTVGETYYSPHQPERGLSLALTSDLVDSSARLDAIGPLNERVSGAMSISPTGPPTIQVRHILQQLTQAVPTTTPGTTEILLQPEELGKVRMSLSLQDGAMTLAIHTERPETSDLMRRHIDQLAQVYRQMGFDSMNFSFTHAGPQEGPADAQDLDQSFPHEGGDVAVATLSPPAHPQDGRLDLRM